MLNFIITLFICMFSVCSINTSIDHKENDVINESLPNKNLRIGTYGIVFNIFELTYNDELLKYCVNKNPSWFTTSTYFSEWVCNFGDPINNRNSAYIMQSQYFDFEELSDNADENKIYFDSIKFILRSDGYTGSMNSLYYRLFSFSLYNSVIGDYCLPYQFQVRFEAPAEDVGSGYTNYTFRYIYGAGAYENTMDYYGVIYASYNANLYSILSEVASISWNQGYNTGYSNGINNGQSVGYNTGYTEGYNTGYDEASDYYDNYNSTALTIFTGVLEVGLLPINVFLKILNFEVFGINISGFVSAFLTISIVVIIIRLIMGGKNDK